MVRILQIALLFFLPIISLKFSPAQSVYTWNYSYGTDKEIILNGVLTNINPETYYYFEYSKDSSYSFQTTLKSIDTTSSYMHVEELFPNMLEDGIYNYRLVLQTGEEKILGNSKNVEINKSKAPVAETGNISFPGTVENYRPPSITLNGNVQANGSPTSYYFEYGPTSAYGASTPKSTIGPKLNAVFTENWNDLSQWNSWGSIEKFTEGGSADNFIRASAGSSIDYNHINSGSVGPILLMLYAYTGLVYPYDNWNNALMLGGGYPDFRDAEVSMYIRNADLIANGARLSFWIQSEPERRVGIDSLDWVRPKDWTRSNWTYSDKALPDSTLRSIREWQLLKFSLTNDASKWKYSGTNYDLFKPWTYSYHSLDHTLSNLNIDFFFNLIDIKVDSLPQGSLDFRELNIKYRNYSLLSKDNGGSLVSWPQESIEDPYTLTDGFRHGKANMWHSTVNPSGPQEFVYKFDKEVLIEKVQLHQHTQWPSETVEILSSNDGENYTFIEKVNVPKALHDDDNSAFYLLRLPNPISAKYLKIQITSGYFQERWGLGEIEVFGEGAVYMPGFELSGVNQDVSGLQIDVPYHYRLVAENEFGKVYGEDRIFTIPGNPISFVNTEDTLIITNKDFTYDLEAKWQMPHIQTGDIRFEPLVYPQWLDLNPTTGVSTVLHYVYNVCDSLFTVRAFDVNGQSAIKTFYLKTIPQIYIEGPTVLGEGDSTILTANFADGLFYQWQLNGENIEDATDKTFRCKTPGKYTLVLTSGEGCEAKSLEVNILPEIIVFAGDDESFCENDTPILLTNYYPPRGEWSGNGVDKKGKFYPSPALEGKQTLTYTVKDYDGEDITDQKVITVLPSPDGVHIAVEGDTSLCEGDISILKAPEGYINYLWSTGDTIPSITVSASGSYWVKVSNGYCENTSDIVTIYVHSIPANPGIEIKDKYILTATTKGSTYEWTLNGQLLENTNQSINAYETGVYKVRVKNGQYCFSEFSESYYYSVPNDYFPHFEVNPNPNTGIFTLKLLSKSKDQASIYITNLAGRMVYQTDTKEFEGIMSVNMDISSLPKGVYLINVHIGNKTLHRKLILL